MTRDPLGSWSDRVEPPAFNLSSLSDEDLRTIRYNAECDDRPDRELIDDIGTELSRREDARGLAVEMAGAERMFLAAAE